MDACPSRTNADDRLPLVSLGPVEGGDGTVEGRHVADDPMERANLKDRQRDAFDRLSKEWLAWNSTMLPEVPESNSGGNNADRWADHIGLRSTTEPDNPGTESSR